jgi:hypothetical protein
MHHIDLVYARVDIQRGGDRKDRGAETNAKRPRRSGGTLP